MRSDRLRLQDILDACATIEHYKPASRLSFDADPPLRSHILLHLQVIGEAAAKVSQPLRDAHPHIPWKSMAGVRNIIAHVYFGIDWDEIWRVICHDLPVLRHQIQAILDALPDDDAP